MNTYYRCNKRKSVIGIIIGGDAKINNLPITIIAD